MADFMSDQRDRLDDFHSGLKHVKEVIRRQRRHAVAQCHDFDDEDPHVFYDMPLRVTGSHRNHCRSHHHHDHHHKEKCHHNHHHHHHHHSKNTRHLPIRLCLSHPAAVTRDSATQTSFVTRTVTQPVTRSQVQTDDRYPQFTRKVLSLTDLNKEKHADDGRCHRVPVRVSKPVNPAPLRSSSCPRTQKPSSSTYSYSSGHPKSTRSFSNLPKDKLNDLLFIANVQRRDDEADRQDEETKCRKKKSHDVDEIHEYMKNQKLIRKVTPVKYVAPVLQKEKPYDPSEIRRLIDEKRKEQRQLQQKEEAVKKQNPSTGKHVTWNSLQQDSRRRAPVNQVNKTTVRRKRLSLLNEDPLASEQEVKQMLANVLTANPLPEMLMPKMSQLTDQPHTDFTLPEKEITFTLFDQIIDKRNLTFNQSMITSNCGSSDIMSKLTLDDTLSSGHSNKVPDEREVERERHQDTKTPFQEPLTEFVLHSDQSDDKNKTRSPSAKRPDDLNRTIDNLIAEGLRRERLSFERLIEEALSNSLIRGNTTRDHSLDSSPNSSSNNGPTCESLPMDESLSESQPKHSNIRPLDRDSSCISVYVQHDRNNCISCLCSKDESADCG